MIEMMIVMAIIAILAAVSVPAFMKYVDKNKKGGTIQGPMWDGMTCTEHTSVGGKGGNYTLCQDGRVWCYLVRSDMGQALSCVRKSF